MTWERAGDREREVFLRYGPKVYRFFVRRGFDREEARDLNQETFFRVYKHMGALREEGALAGWIMRIATHVWINELRFRKTDKRRGVEVPVDVLAEAGDRAAGPVDRAAPPEGALGKLLAAEELATLRRCLGELPPRMRVCLLKFLIDERKYREIARDLELSIGTVKSHIHQAREHLRGCLGRVLGTAAT